MKTSKFVLFLILVVAVLIVVGSCAKEKPDYISKDYEIYGTWVNPDYNKTSSWGKIIFYPYGKFELYHADTKTRFDIFEDFIVTNKWTDSKGNIWYTCIFEGGNRNWDAYVLIKISNSGKTLELADSTSDYPKEVDPKDSSYLYLIYYRQ